MLVDQGRRNRLLHPNDVERWRAKLDQIESAAATDSVVQEQWRELDELRPIRDAEARQLIDQLVETHDFAAFREGADAWCRRPGPYRAFQGFGQMWVNQVANNLPSDPDAVAVIVRAFTPPSSAEEAAERFAEVEGVTRDLASKGQPAVGRIPYVLSVFWSTADVKPGWPILWNSAPERMYDLGWVRSWSNADRYLTFLEVARTFYPDDVHRFERLMWYLTERQRFVGLNPTLSDMCFEAAGLMASFQSGAGYASEVDEERAASLAAQLKGELYLATIGLLEDMRTVTGHELEEAQLQLKTSFDQAAPFRADAYATWSLPGGMSAPGLRLWATQSGVALGIYGGWKGSAHGAEYQEVAAVVADAMPAGFTFFQVRPHRTGDRLAPTETYDGGEVFAGKWWRWEEVPQGLALKDEALAVVDQLTPALSALARTTDEESAPSEAHTVSSDIRAAVEAFKSQRPYPNDKDEWHQEQRALFAEALSPENLSVFDLDLFRKFINGKRYGNPGPQSVLNSSLSAMDSIKLDEFAGRLREILWGEDDIATRIDRGLDWDDLGTRGLGESVLLKLLAVTDPARFLPIFPLTGPMGKIAVLKRLGLPLPDSSLSRGQQQVEANDTLRSALEPLLPGDSWGQAQFAYWLLANDTTAVPEEEDRLAAAAAELLVPESFLREIGDLIQEKGQLIFYGPPGTGKTYLADRFAAALQPDPERRMLVQFHPSMSYEDFFEGYRPETDERGQLTYRLRSGPLALMAEKAEQAPGIPHFLIIDEINRANLPRVFGELLFLLEYRNKSVRTAYRPDEPFELPKNLYFIGTMNTADRSIAVVDAALRRRFHFIPFMPHEGPMKSLLADWLRKHDEPVWVANLVDQVNEQLRILLKGPHLQVGHSHFMVTSEHGGRALTDERLARIWEYDVFPFIEDQLYGRPDQLEMFTWAKVLEAYGPGSESAKTADLASDAGAGDEPVH